MKVLITGSRGYIGSVLAKTLASQGHMPLGVDRNINSRGSAIYGLFHHANFEDRFVAQMVSDLKIDTICHLAADADVPDSVERPGKYYENNTSNTIKLLNNLVENKWRGKFIFSSTAAVYKEKNSIITETDVLEPPNPYGMSKLMCEQVLKDYHKVYGIDVVNFRYFNVAGAWDDVGDHLNSPHVIQRLCHAATNGNDFHIFGTDKNTTDGTCVRDYLHVRDVCDAHLQAIKHLNNNKGYYNYNLGTSFGVSVRSLVASFMLQTKENISISSDEGRPGDPDHLVADGHRFMADTKYTYNYSNLNNIIDSAWIYYKGKGSNYYGF